jgi:5S rRNA maturation endonuclease (ribonuclease M5)
VSLEIQAFLERLERVTRSGEEWRARCPAHEDRNPSLSLRDTADRILVRCFAGCTVKQIVGALKLREADLFHHNDSQSGPSLGDPISTWNYVDENGRLLFQVQKFRPVGGKKVFKQRHKDPDTGQWVWKMTDVRRVLYRLPEVIKGVAEGKTIFIVEGEKDVDAMRRLGVVATCNPMGALKWRDEYSLFLAGAKVAIVADRDDDGRRHADRVRDSLARQGVAKIWMLQAKVGNDASDHIKAGLGIKDFVPRRQRTHGGILTMAEMAVAAQEELRAGPSQAPSYAFSPVLPINFRPGRIYCVAAYTSDGKTRFGLQGFRTLASAGHHIGYFSLEMSSRDLLHILVAHRGIPLELTEDPWRLRDDPKMYKLYIDALDELGTWTAEMIVEPSMNADTITDYTRDREYDVVVVDHLHRFDWDERRSLEQQLQKLTNLAIDSNVCLILLCQLRRQTSKDRFPEPTLVDMKETGAIEQEASMVISIWRPRFDNVEPSGNTKFRILKNRHTLAEWDRAGSYWDRGYDTLRQSFISIPISGGETSWDGAVGPVNAEDVVRENGNVLHFPKV